MKPVNKEIIQQLNSEIRKIKISNVLDKKKYNFDNRFDINNISSEKREIVNKFTQWGAITGSTLYSLYKFISRPANDIDLLVDEKGLNEIEKDYKVIRGDFYRGTKSNSIGYINYKTETIDIFLVDDISKCKTINGIKIDDIFHSIKMKLDLYENSIDRKLYKDDTDLNEILIILQNYNIDSIELKKPLVTKISNFFKELL